MCVFPLFFIFWVQMASWNKKKREKFYLTLLSSIICQKGGKYKPALTPLVASVVERFQCNLHPHTDRQELQERERTTALLYTYIIIFIPNWFRKKTECLVNIPLAVGSWYMYKPHVICICCVAFAVFAAGDIFRSGKKTPKQEKKFQLMFTK